MQRFNRSTLSCSPLNATHRCRYSKNTSSRYIWMRCIRPWRTALSPKLSFSSTECRRMFHWQTFMERSLLVKILMKCTMSLSQGRAPLKSAFEGSWFGRSWRKAASRPLNSLRNVAKVLFNPNSHPNSCSSPGHNKDFPRTWRKFLNQSRRNLG